MNIPARTTRLDEAQRARLVQLAEVLMPAGAGLPAPTEVDVHREWIDRALDAVPMMVPVVEVALQAPGEPAEAMERLSREQPQVFMAFTFILSGAYFLHPRVRQALGYEGLAIQPKPPLEGEAEFYLEDGLLETVLSRGPIYRQVP